jgi:hypothetical protein
LPIKKVNGNFQHVPKIFCKITPLYGSIQNVLKVSHQRPQKRVSLTTWQPTDNDDFEIVWRLDVTLSTGERYSMNLPVCSLNRWRSNVEAYFAEHPTKRVFLDNIVSIWHHKTERYNYKEVNNFIKYVEQYAAGATISEILLKLSIFFNYPDKDKHLKTILVDDGQELLFSGKIIWDTPIV